MHSSKYDPVVQCAYHVQRTSTRCMSKGPAHIFWMPVKYCVMRYIWYYGWRNYSCFLHSLRKFQTDCISNSLSIAIVRYIITIPSPKIRMKITEVCDSKNGELRSYTLHVSRLRLLFALRELRIPYSLLFYFYRIPITKLDYALSQVKTGFDASLFQMEPYECVYCGLFIYSSQIFSPKTKIQYLHTI